MSVKFWLEPDIALESNYGFNRKELRDIERLIRQNVETLRNKWDDFCESKSGAG